MKIDPRNFIFIKNLFNSQKRTWKLDYRYQTSFNNTRSLITCTNECISNMNIGKSKVVRVNFQKYKKLRKQSRQQKTQKKQNSKSV